MLALILWLVPHGTNSQGITVGSLLLLYSMGVGALIAVLIILYRRVSFLGQPAALPVLPGTVPDCAV